MQNALEVQAGQAKLLLRQLVDKSLEFFSGGHGGTRIAFPNRCDERFIKEATSSCCAEVWLDKEEVHGAAAQATPLSCRRRPIQELDSQIGALEEDAEAFDSENWRDVVPRIKDALSLCPRCLRHLEGEPRWHCGTE